MSGGTMRSSSRDPYTALGLDHNASAKQIKIAYRKLALRYHPDRQRQHPSDQRNPEDAANKFTEISSAYAILSDPIKKSEYDHLYKFGAFDDMNGGESISETRDDNAADNSCNNAATSGSGYKYTENLSGGYYTNKASTSSTSDPAATTSPPPFFNFVELKKQDSFFDELLHLSKNKAFPNDCSQQQHSPTTNKNSKEQKRPGIGFSIRSMGKHLSIHVPSKSEIMTSVASGEPLPNHFGTRVTYSTSERVRNSRTTSLISTTTRIAHGQQRTVKRTVCIQPDGKKEEVIEENGEVKGRHIEELCPPPSSAAAAGKAKDAPTQRKEWQTNQAAATCHGWPSGVICGLRDCVIGPCLGLQGV